jgi:hypothetical protein
MPTTRILGKIYPAILERFPGPLPSKRYQNSSGLTIDVDIKIANSEFEIVCQSNRLAPQSEILPIAAIAIRITIDLFSFATGIGLVPLLECYIDPDGTKTLIQSRSPYLTELNTTITSTNDFVYVLGLLAESPVFYMALNDLAVALSQFHNTPINCARAIDGLRHLLSNADSSRSEQWAEMHNKLRVTHKYLQLISDNSKLERHGKRHELDPMTVKEIGVRPWTVMNRYIEFRKRGGAQPFPTKNFLSLIIR